MSYIKILKDFIVLLVLIFSLISLRAIKSEVETVKIELENTKNNLYQTSFYRFIEIKNKKRLKVLIEKFLDNLALKGTILLSDEGINGSLSGGYDDLEIFIKFIICIRAH